MWTQLKTIFAKTLSFIGFPRRRAYDSDNFSMPVIKLIEKIRSGDDKSLAFHWKVKLIKDLINRAEENNEQTILYGVIIDLLTEVTHSKSDDQLYGQLLDMFLNSILTPLIQRREFSIAEDCGRVLIERLRLIPNFQENNSPYYADCMSRYLEAMTKVDPCSNLVEIIKQYNRIPFDKIPLIKDPLKKVDNLAIVENLYLIILDVFLQHFKNGKKISNEQEVFLENVLKKLMYFLKEVKKLKQSSLRINYKLAQLQCSMGDYENMIETAEQCLKEVDQNSPFYANCMLNYLIAMTMADPYNNLDKIIEEYNKIPLKKVDNFTIMEEINLIILDLFLQHYENGKNIPNEQKVFLKKFLKKEIKSPEHNSPRINCKLAYLQYYREDKNMRVTAEQCLKQLDKMQNKDEDQVIGISALLKISYSGVFFKRKKREKNCLKKNCSNYIELTYPNVECNSLQL